jgi:hypothetical protein
MNQSHDDNSSSLVYPLVFVIPGCMHNSHMKYDSLVNTIYNMSLLSPAPTNSVVSTVSYWPKKKLVVCRREKLSPLGKCRWRTSTLQTSAACL